MSQDSKDEKGLPKVLVVDDELNFCKLAMRVLRAKQYEVDMAGGGEEAISKIYDFNPAVVILDILMPRLTGDELVKMIRAWKPELQVIMVSAVGTGDLKDECFKNGAFAFFQKPVDFDLLDKKIQEAIIEGKKFNPKKLPGQEFRRSS